MSEVEKDNAVISAPKEITQEELVQDLQTIGNVVQQHDQSIFQIIASLNAIQSILLDKDLCQEKDLTDATQTEAKVLQDKILAMVNKETDGDVSSEETDSSDDGD